MTYKTDWVQSYVQNGILTITLNRADKQNALTHAMYMKMVDIMQSGDASELVKLVVLQGDGPNFTAGNDIADFLATDKPISEVGAVVWLNCLATMSKPVIAKVRGNAVGVGTTCLLHCDLVYSDNTAKFSMPFTQLGLCPEAGVSLLLPRLVGHQRASELLLLGKRFYANDALEMGIVNQVTEPDALDEVVSEVALQLAELPQESVLLTKQLLKTESESVTDRMSREFALFEKQLHSDTAKAIFEQFLNR